MGNLCNIRVGLPLHVPYSDASLVGCCSSNWREAAKTLKDLAENNGLAIHKTVHFHEPYVGLEEIPAIVEDTYQQTRSQYTSNSIQYKKLICRRQTARRVILLGNVFLYPLKLPQSANGHVTKACTLYLLYINLSPISCIDLKQP